MLRAAALLGLLAAVASPALAYEVVTVADGGTLSGTVKFAGTPPRLEPTNGYGSTPPPSP